MIEEILPAEVISAEAFDDTADAYLFPEEQAVIVNAVQARRREFGTVRRCAREALAALGYPPAPLLPGQERAPQWPAGIVGSMTHCTDYRAAVADARRARAPAAVAVGAAVAVAGVATVSAKDFGRETDKILLHRGAAARSGAAEATLRQKTGGPCGDYRAAAVGRGSVVQTIGIDAEPNLPLPDGVLDLVSLPQERRALAELRRAGDRVQWDRLLFSCKESVYKAWYPLARRWLGFEDAMVSIDPVAAAFTARILVPGPVIGGEELRGFRGRWLARDGLLVTAIAVLG
jgi:4'-phosphopantetheinyl transferase EntD